MKLRNNKVRNDRLSWTRHAERMAPHARPRQIMNYVLKEDSLDARNCGVYRDRIEGQNLDVYDGDNNIAYVFTVLKIRREVLSLFSFSVSFSSSCD